jgi:hypothetical protein
MSVEQMMEDYGIHHRISSVANPHANARAELGVKTVKRMLRDNMSQNGGLDMAKLPRALLQLRNTPDLDTKRSPAQCLFGRELKDFLPRPTTALMGDMWVKLADAREEALARRSLTSENLWAEHTKALAPLKVVDAVLIQNQTGNHPLRWDKSGKVVQNMGNDQYMVVVDGSRRTTRRNRKYLRLFKPYNPTALNKVQLNKQVTQQKQAQVQRVPQAVQPVNPVHQEVQQQGHEQHHQGQGGQGTVGWPIMYQVSDRKKFPIP